MSNKIDFAVGGQAVIEGVMMRSPNYYTVSVRDQNGEIKFKQEKFASLIKKYKIFGLPIVRGVVHLFESMKIGFKALDYSNAVYLGEEEKVEKDRGMILNIVFAAFGMLYVVGSLALTIFLLKFLPLWLAGKAADIWPAVESNYLLFNSIDGLAKISIFVGYILAISVFADMRRVFQYHGAEHKSIWAYEKGLELTVENAKKQTRFHPRCGTSFIFIVIMMSIFVYTLIPQFETFGGMLLSRILALPLIAGVSYEFLKMSAKKDNALLRLFTLPGLCIQRLTTREPDDKQLEIALYSLRESLRVEKVIL